jgi:hypothetical protein
MELSVFKENLWNMDFRIEKVACFRAQLTVSVNPLVGVGW